MSEDRIVVRGIPAHHPKCAIEFLSQVIKLSKMGYELVVDPKTVRERATFVGFPSCVMYREEGDIAEVVVEPAIAVEAPAPVADTPVVDELVQEAVAQDAEPEDESDTTLVDEVKGLSGKADLVSFAERNGIEIPDSVKVPLAIKKFLIEHLSK